MMASRLEEEKSERLHPLVWALAIVQPEKNGSPLCPLLCILYAKLPIISGQDPNLPLFFIGARPNLRLFCHSRRGGNPMITNCSGLGLPRK